MTYQGSHRTSIAKIFGECIVENVRSLQINVATFIFFWVLNLVYAILVWLIIGCWIVLMLPWLMYVHFGHWSDSADCIGYSRAVVAYLSSEYSFVVETCCLVTDYVEIWHDFEFFLSALNFLSAFSILIGAEIIWHIWFVHSYA